MSFREPHISHRFVVLYRREPREIDGASEQWRGWVSRVQAPGEEAGAGAEQRVCFRELSELPAAVEALIQDASHAGKGK